MASTKGSSRCINMYLCYYGSMRTTIDIPDEMYRALKIQAAHEGVAVRQIVLRGIERELEPEVPRPRSQKFQIPVIRSSRPGTLNLTNEQIDDILASDLTTSS